MNWWTEESTRQFEERAQCFVQQYDNFVVKVVGRNVNGTLTLAENLSDDGGLKAAYDVFGD